MTQYLRGCAGCSAAITTNDPATRDTFCTACRPKHVTPFDRWAANLKASDRVFVQPVVAWNGLSRSENTVISRDGDDITVQIIGLPESRQTVRVTQLAQRDVTPRPVGGWLR